MWASGHFLSASVHVYVELTIMVITMRHNLDYFIIEVDICTCTLSKVISKVLALF